jgi:hypothetical protein
MVTPLLSGCRLKNESPGQSGKIGRNFCVRWYYTASTISASLIHFTA